MDGEKRAPAVDPVEKEVIWLTSGHTSWVEIFKDWATPEEEDACVELARTQPRLPYTWNGRTGLTLRRVGNFHVDGGSYKYNSINHDCAPFPDVVAQMAGRMGAMTDECYGRRPGIAVLNYYPDRSVGIGAHSDSGPGVFETADGNTTIFSVSFGDTRELHLFPQRGASPTDGARYDVHIPMPPRALVLMCGRAQKTHFHAIAADRAPKRARDGTHDFRADEERVNLTLRLIDTK